MTQSTVDAPTRNLLLAVDLGVFVYSLLRTGGRGRGTAGGVRTVDAVEHTVMERAASVLFK